MVTINRKDFVKILLEIQSIFNKIIIDTRFVDNDEYKKLVFSKNLISIFLKDKINSHIINKKYDISNFNVDKDFEINIKHNIIDRLLFVFDNIFVDENIDIDFENFENGSIHFSDSKCEYLFILTMGPYK